MSGPITIQDGQTITQDPSASRVITVDWDDHLAAGVTIATSAFSVLALRPTATPTLTKDDTPPLGIQAGSRSAKVQLATPTLGALYRVQHTITTSETPAQTVQKSFFVLGEDE